MSFSYIEIGKISKPHGLKGDVKVYPSSSDLSLFMELPSAFICSAGEDKEELFITGVKPHGKFAIVHFKGLDKIEDVEPLAGKSVEIPEEALPPLSEGEFYHFQIIGLKIVTDKGLALGRVEEIIETGSNDVYEVKREDGKSFLIPAIRDVIKKIDLDKKTITIQVIKGLLDGD